MLRYYRVRGLITKRTNYGEADRYIWALTREQGLIQFRAKGVRKITAKLKGALELFVLTDLELAKGRSSDIVTGATIVDSFKNIRKDLQVTSKVFYLSELLHGFLAENDQADLYRLTIDSIKELDREEIGVDGRFIILKFLIRLLNLTGFGPELNNCITCQSKISGKEDKVDFDFDAGGISCCLPADIGQKIDPRTIKLIRLLNEGKINIKVGDRYIEEGEQVLERFAEQILEKRINSNRFLNQGSNA